MKYQDLLTCRTICTLSFADRLRVLWSGQLMVETCTFTENVIGEHTTISKCVVSTDPAESEVQAESASDFKIDPNSMNVPISEDWGNPITP